jgi:hypothetical protein
LLLLLLLLLQCLPCVLYQLLLLLLVWMPSSVELLSSQCLARLLLHAVWMLDLVQLPAQKTYNMQQAEQDTMVPLSWCAKRLLLLLLLPQQCCCRSSAAGFNSADDAAHDCASVALTECLYSKIKTALCGSPA